MGTTTISDRIIPEVFTDYTFEPSISALALIQSGLAVRDPRLDQFVSMGGDTVNVPFNKSVARQSDTVGSDNSASNLVTGKLTSAKMIGARCFRTIGWSDMDLASLLAGDDALTSIGAEVSESWQYNMQRVILAQLKGVFADNTANDAGDMSYSVYSDVVAGSITDAMKISGAAITEAKYTMGDKNDKLVAIAMHSLVKKQLELLEPNAFIPKSQTNTGFDSYQGLMLIIDDDMPVVAGTNSSAYTSYLIGAGAFGAGFNPAANYTPEAVQREELSGDGAGESSLVSRRDFIFHPYGMSFVGTPAGATATNAEFEAATSWDRVYDRKNVSLAALVTNA